MPDTTSTASPRIKVLLLTKSRGFRHDCIPALISALQSLPFAVYATEDSEHLLNCSRYDVVVLGHNTGGYLTSLEVQSLRTYAENGGGVVGVHAATSGMATDEQYSGILGEVFNGHPEPQWGMITIEAQNHYIMDSGYLPVNDSAPELAPPCPDAFRAESQVSFPWYDELYTFKSHPRNKDTRTILLSVNKFSYKEEVLNDYPLAWCHNLGRGRSFYTALGHFDEAYRDKWFMETLHRGIIWAAQQDT
ncbi:hypothetical protein AUP68_16840 [Ilyonectria robusta]